MDEKLAIDTLEEALCKLENSGADLKKYAICMCEKRLVILARESNAYRETREEIYMFQGVPIVINDLIPVNEAIICEIPPWIRIRPGGKVEAVIREEEE